MKSLYRSVGLMACIAFGTTSTTAGERVFELREHLGVPWQNELLTYAFEFPESECHPESLRLQGPTGPVPVQIVRSRSWPGERGGLQSATITFFADLKPLAEDRYVLSWAADPATVSPGPPSGLSIRRAGQFVAVASHAFGAVFRTGAEDFTDPVESASLPRPVRELLLPDGRRFGGSSLYGPTKLVSWSGGLVAEGPVFAEMLWRYRYVDGSEVALRGRLGARDTAIYWDMSCKGTLREDGWQLHVSNGLPPLSLSVQIEHFSKRSLAGRKLEVGDLVAFPVAEQPPGSLTSVTPWADWTNDRTQTVVILNDPAGFPAFFAGSRDPGVWIEPQFDPDKEVWGRVQKSLPLIKRDDGLIALAAPVMDEPGGGLRRWMTGCLPAGAWEAVVEISKNKFTGVVQQHLQLMLDKRRLDWVKDFVLEWPADRRILRPMLVVDQQDIDRCRARQSLPAELIQQIGRVRNAPLDAMPSGSDGTALAAWLLSGSPQVAAEVKAVERLRQRLALLGNFDVMRSAQVVALLYDAIVDSGLVSEPERRLMRARMAYLGYRMEDPVTWSPERGYNTGLPNMNVSYALGRGFVACAIPDHPRAATWAGPAVENMDRWLDRQTGERGEWMEGASYDHVTASTMIAFAIAAKNAGFRDYSKHAKFRLLLDYVAKQYTPPDPTRGNIRVTPPLGRANAGVRMGLFGVVARFMRDDDPDYAAGMQWMWRQSGSHYPVADNRLCGLEYLYIDPDQPARQPAWQSEWFPRSTAVLRNRFGRPHEDYVNILLEPDIQFARPSEVGAVLAWYAFGQPVAGAFTGGYAERHELLTSRVVPAAAPSPQEWKSSNYHKIERRTATFFTQPRLDYVDAEFTIGDAASADWSLPPGMPAWPPVPRPATPPIPWRRQMLFVKGETDVEPSYLVFRDTVGVDQPTLWQMWTASNGVQELGSREPARGREAPEPARPLAGAEFTAAGQHGVDLDFFVVAPAAPQAFTLRWGTRYENPPDIGREEYLDLLQVRRDGRGSYVVVIIPRRRDGRRPRVTSEDEGRVIRVAHQAGEDVVVLNDAAAVTTATGDMFAVPAALLRSRNGVQSLSLGPRGKAQISGQAFEIEEATTIHLEDR